MTDINVTQSAAMSYSTRFATFVYKALIGIRTNVRVCICSLYVAGQGRIGNAQHNNEC